MYSELLTDCSWSVRGVHAVRLFRVTWKEHAQVQVKFAGQELVHEPESMGDDLALIFGITVMAFRSLHSSSCTHCKR